MLQSIDTLTEKDSFKIGNEILKKHNEELKAEIAVKLLSEYIKEINGIKEINLLLEIGNDKKRWKEAYDAFQGIRKLTLIEKSKNRSTTFSYFLYFTEIVAKLIYNGSGSIAPFDDDSYVWLLPNLVKYIKKYNKEIERKELWERINKIQEN